MDMEETKVHAGDNSPHGAHHENTTELIEDRHSGAPDEDITVSPREEEEAAVNKLHEQDWSMKNSPPKATLP